MPAHKWERKHSMKLNRRDVVITGMARTPIGNFRGALASKTAVELGVAAGGEALRRAGIVPGQVEEVLAGVVYKAGLKGNPARQIQLALDIPVSAGAVTIEQQCASGMRAMEIGSQQILLGRTDVCLVCGIESMSNVPHYNMSARGGTRLGAYQIEDGLLFDALHDAFDGKHMALTAERVATQYAITRKDCDALAVLSHDRAIEAIAAGKFQTEIVPVEVKTRKGVILVDTDEHPRKTSMEELGSLKAAFQPGGVVTAGNASSMNDAACALVLMSAEKAESLGLAPLAVLRGSVTVGVLPEIMGVGPIYAIPKVLEQAGLKKDDIRYYEINEAFAAQFLACQRTLALDMGMVNANGSGISLGHPVGCTGVRIVMAAVSELRRRGGGLGCASLCVGGGPAMAAIVETL